MNAFDLTGRTALVTGSTRGLGSVIASALAAAGARVVLHGRDRDRLAEAAAVARSRYGDDRILTAEFDVADPAAVIDGIAELLDRSGVPDVLVNNAGVQHREPLLDVSPGDWDRVIRTNLTSAFLVGREVARGMIVRGGGKIVNIASVQADLARPSIGPYTAAKGGLRNLTRAMCAEWAGSNIQVNAIAPGYLRTEMTEALAADPEFDAWLVARTPARRWGTAEDVTGAAVWLASSASDFVNGQVVYVDGGMSVVV